MINPTNMSQHRRFPQNSVEFEFGEFRLAGSDFSLARVHVGPTPGSYGGRLIGVSLSLGIDLCRNFCIFIDKMLANSVIYVTLGFEAGGNAQGTLPYTDFGPLQRNQLVATSSFRTIALANALHKPGVASCFKTTHRRPPSISKE